MICQNMMHITYKFSFSLLLLSIRLKIESFNFQCPNVSRIEGLLNLWSVPLFCHISQRHILNVRGRESKLLVKIWKGFPMKLFRVLSYYGRLNNVISPISLCVCFTIDSSVPESVLNSHHTT